MGWLGAAVLWVGCAFWGRSLRQSGITGPALLLTLAAVLLGFSLTLWAAWQGETVPLIAGAVGGVLIATAAVFQE